MPKALLVGGILLLLLGVLQFLALLSYALMLWGGSVQLIRGSILVLVIPDLIWVITFSILGMATLRRSQWARPAVLGVTIAHVWSHSSDAINAVLLGQPFPGSPGAILRISMAIALLLIGITTFAWYCTPIVARGFAAGDIILYSPHEAALAAWGWGSVELGSVYTVSGIALLATPYATSTTFPFVVFPANAMIVIGGALCFKRRLLGVLVVVSMMLGSLGMALVQIYVEAKYPGVTHRDTIANVRLLESCQRLNHVAFLVAIISYGLYLFRMLTHERKDNIRGRLEGVAPRLIPSLGIQRVNSIEV